MAKAKIVGVDKLLVFLQVAEKQSRRMIGRSIYPAADYVMKEVMEQMIAVPIDDSAFGNRVRRGPTSRQKYWMFKSVGIAKLRNDSKLLNVKIGFDGYTDIPSANGGKVGYLPVALLARAVNKGTSFMAPNPFMDIAIKKSERGAIKIMDEAMMEEIEKAWKRYGPRV